MELGVGGGMGVRGSFGFGFAALVSFVFDALFMVGVGRNFQLSYSVALSYHIGRSYMIYAYGESNNLSSEGS